MEYKWNTSNIRTSTSSNELLMPVHVKMLVILPKDNVLIWINHENQNKEELLSLFKPYPAEGMKMEEVMLRLGDY